MSKSCWHQNQKLLSSSAQCGAWGKETDVSADEELPNCHTPYWCRQNQTPCKARCAWNSLSCPSFFVIYTYTNTQRATGCVSNLSYVSKITSFGQWCNITRTDTVSGLCFLVCELSSQGFCCFASDVLKIQTIFRYTPKFNYHVLTIDPHTQQLNLTETIIIIPTECHDLIMTSINKIPAENILMLKKLQRKQNIVSTVPNVKCVNC